MLSEWQEHKLEQFFEYCDRACKALESIAESLEQKRPDFDLTDAAGRAVSVWQHNGNKHEQLAAMEKLQEALEKTRS